MTRVRKRAWLLAIVSGVLQVLVFPSVSLYFLCWIALAPLIVAVLSANAPAGVELVDSRGRQLSAATVGQGFTLAFVNGLIFYAGTVFWIYHTLHVYGGMGTGMASFLLVLLLLACACHHGIFGALLAWAARTRTDGIRRALALAPFLWVTIELGWERIIGFPWNPLGTVQVDNIPLARIATVTGAYGLSFGVALVNAAFAAAFLLPASRRRVMLIASAAAAALLQLGVLVRPAPLATTHTATLVQQNIPILEPSQWTVGFFQQTLTELASISTWASGSPSSEPGLIVWPESPAPFYINDLNFRRTISDIARRNNAYVVAGVVAVRRSARRDQPTELLNSAALVAPDGNWTTRYDKIHLVPFGEYVPFKRIFFFIDKITKEAGDFGRGSERKVLDLGGPKLGVFICYESIFPDEVLLFARSRAQVFANISNDEWFGDISAPGST